MKIGELVRTFIPEIFQYCQDDPSELDGLMDADYCKRMFGLYFPFCTRVAEISPFESVRYWSKEYTVNGIRLRVCSQWYEYQRNNFREYVTSKDISTGVDLAVFDEEASDNTVEARLYPSRGWGDGKLSFRDWLIEQGHPERSISSRISNVRRVEEYYGDLDDHYAKDRLAGLLASLRYSTQDERRGRPNPTLIPINGNIRNNLATYVSGLMLYARFAAQNRHEAVSEPSGFCRESSQPHVGGRMIQEESSLIDSSTAHAEKLPFVERPEQKVHQNVKSDTRLSAGTVFGGVLRAQFHLLMSLFGDSNRHISNATTELRTVDNSGDESRLAVEQKATSQPHPQNDMWVVEVEAEHPHAPMRPTTDPHKPIHESSRIVRVRQRSCHDDNAVSIERIRLWASKPYSNVHKIIAVALHSIPVSREWLAHEVRRRGISRSSYGAIASLMTNSGNAYGRIFVEQAGYLYFHPDIEGVIKTYEWAHPPQMT